jgi:dihydroorotate dehydrogenase
MLYESFTKYRNIIISYFYKYILKPIFFKIDPEDIHDNMISTGKFLGKFPSIRYLFSLIFDYKNPSLNQKILNMEFINPIGLSAGFDKNAELTELLPSIGFGFIEIGSITGEYCPGNAKPRLWRMPLSQSLIVYYGLKNDGAEKISKRLENKKHHIPLGINVAMTNCQNNLDINNAIEDFKKAFEIMKSHADYITINISCPNALGGQPFIKPENLENLLNILDRVETDRPRFIKLSPDLQKEEIDIILNILKNHKIQGIICSNLTKNRDNKKIHQNENNITDKGGISGKIVKDLSDELLSYIYKKEGKRFILIGVGGIFSAEDVYKKIRNGASLVQLITGMIFEGPSLISNINQDLVKLLKRDGFNNISEAIGIDIN